MRKKILMLSLVILWSLPTLALGDAPHIVSTSPDQNELNVAVSNITDQHPAHTYQETGYNNIKLVVSNAQGTDSLIKEDYIYAAEWGGGTCSLSYTSWNPHTFWAGWRAGDKVAIYMDPGDCGNPENYPFRFTEVEFFLYDHWPVGYVRLRFKVEEAQPTLCDGPGSELWESHIYCIQTFYPDTARISLPNGVCVNQPFFFSVEYMSDHPHGSMPSLLWDWDALPVDTCYQWVWWGGWYEWDEFWSVSGWVTLRISGYAGIQADFNADGVIDIGDAVFLINYVLKGGPAPIPEPAGDVNCDGLINVGDIVYLVNYLFRGGPPPCEP
jgi:PKD repeat protein